MTERSAGATLVRGGTVITMDDARRVIPDGAVVIEGSRITAVGRRDEVTAPAGAAVLDARGRYVIPGLIQAHLHLCQTLFRNLADDLELLDWLKLRIWPFEAAHDAGSMRSAAELGIAELLRGGTTALLDMGTVGHYDVVFEAAERTGIRLTGGKAMMDLGDDVPRGLRESTRASVDESVALAQRWHGKADGRLRYAFCPRFALSCTDDLLREVGSLVAGANDGVMMHTHASENRTECRLVRERFGRENIHALHELGLVGDRAGLAHCVWVDESERALLAQTGAAVLHCPGSNLKLASGIAPIPELMEAGATVAIGADGAPCNNNLDAFGEMRLAALIQKPRLGPRAMPARTVLELATRGGAAALGLDAEIGSLEAGKRADLVVLDPGRIASFPGDEPYGRVVYSVSADQVEHVFVDGRPLLRDGRLLTLDEDEVMTRAGSDLARVLSRADTGT